MASGRGDFSGLSQSGSPAPKGKDQSRQTQGVLPVFIRQILTCHGDHFSMFGLKPQILTIIGKLRKYDMQTTKTTFDVEDRTGKISAVSWNENDTSEFQNLPMVKEGLYVRVYGSLRTHENVKTLMVLKMQPVDQLNELITHILEVIHARLEAEYLFKNSGDQVKANHPGTDLAKSMVFLEETTGNFMAGFTPLQSKVYKILAPVTTCAGLSIQSIVSSCANNQEKDVKSALEFLVSEGHVYTTIDNDHYKVTESM